MASTIFVNGVTLSDADWFNDADATEYDGLTTQILVGGGAGVEAVWTTATGTGAPVRAGGPTLTGHLLFTDNTYDIGASGATRPRTLYLSNAAVTAKVYGGEAVGSSLELRSTTETGTTDHIKATVGTNGGTEVWRVLNGGTFVGGGKVISDGGATTGWEFGAAAAPYLAVCRSGGVIGAWNRTTSDGAIHSFLRDNSEKGSISISGSTTAFNTSSSKTLKIDNGIATDISVLQLTEIHNFTWKEDGVAAVGVFAQDALKVKPIAVQVGSEDGKTGWGVDYSKYVPDLIVGWKDHESRITDLLAWKAKAEAAMEKAGITIQ